MGIATIGVGARDRTHRSTVGSVLNDSIGREGQIRRRIVDRRHGHTDHLRAGIARIIGNRYGEAVAAVVVGIRCVVPQPGRRIDARGPVRRIRTHAKYRAVAQPVAVGGGEGPGHGGVFVAAPARAAGDTRGIVHGCDGHSHGRGLGHAAARDGVGKAVGAIKVRGRRIGHGPVR